jgi:uncharacterized repeat protein (TIGR01451 family)
MPRSEKQFSYPARKGAVAGGLNWAAERNGGAVSFLPMSKLQRVFLRSLVLVVLGCLLLAPAYAQLGTKLVATGAAGVAQQGYAVSTSSDGNTMIVGGPNDNGGTGAVWTYSRSGGVWTQGSKLPGSGGQFGMAVAISADGNTAIVGAPYYNGTIGAVWIFTQSGGSWGYQAGPLVASDYIGTGDQGFSVAISSDGNTVAVGGPWDNTNVGAVWVWTRTGTSWSQQTSTKLIGSTGTGPSFFGESVGLSGDGNTLIAGGANDNNNAGAAWIFTRSGSTWSQVGNKLVGSPAANPSGQGASVAISSDATTAIVGGYGDNNYTGAVWIFTQSAGTWGQQAGPLVGTGAAGAARQGRAVAMSSDGNKAIVGGYADAGNVGASWLFLRLYNSWSQSGGKLTALDASGTSQQGFGVALSEDGSTEVIGGPGDATNVGATWVNILVPDLIVTVTDNGASPNHLLQRGGSGTFTITVANTGGGPTNATVTVVATLPTGLTASTMSGSGWSCTVGNTTCTRGDALAAGASYPVITLAVNVASNVAASTLTAAFAVSGGGETNTGNDSGKDMVTLPTAPVLAVAVSHNGSLYVGRNGVPYTIRVSNIGNGSTSGTVTVTANVPAGLTLASMSGNNWNCSSPPTCTRSDGLAANASYPDVITLTLNVTGGAGTYLTVVVTVSGGAEVINPPNTGSDRALVSAAGSAPGLTIALSHVGTFTRGSTGAYAIVVSNTGGGATSGMVTVTDSLPGGLTATSIDGGRGWKCTLSPLKCTRNDSLVPGLSYHFISLTVNVGGSAGTVTNSATVSGGSTTGSTATDPTVVQ